MCIVLELPIQSLLSQGSLGEGMHAQTSMLHL